MNNDMYVDQCFPATQVDLYCNTLMLCILMHAIGYEMHIHDCTRPALGGQVINYYQVFSFFSGDHFSIEAPTIASTQPFTHSIPPLLIAIIILTIIVVAMYVVCVSAVSAVYCRIRREHERDQNGTPI